MAFMYLLTFTLTEWPTSIISYNWTTWFIPSDLEWYRVSLKEREVSDSLIRYFLYVKRVDCQLISSNYLYNVTSDFCISTVYCSYTIVLNSYASQNTNCKWIYIYIYTCTYMGNIYGLEIPCRPVFLPFNIISEGKPQLYNTTLRTLPRYT